MLTEQCIGLDNEQDLLPELGGSGQDDQSNEIAIGELESFHLAVKHDDLLGENANDKICGDRFSPLFDVAPRS